MLKTSDIRERLKEIEQFMLDEYKESREEKKRDWRTYEQRLMHRIKGAMKNLEPLVEEAIKTIKIQRGKGNRPELSLKQRTLLLLLKELFGKSNRMMASMLFAFSLLSGIDVSYKTVERLYSDHEVEMAIHNLHVLMLKKKGVGNVNASGDGTGYSLTIKKHYASEAHKRKEKIKSSPDQKIEGKMKRAFVYSFKMLDLKTGMYVAYGMSMKSEKEAFDKAMEMLTEINKSIVVILESVRLDKYYSSPSYVDRFGNAKVYIIPKKNATVRGSHKWKHTMMEFAYDTFPYLGQYYLRNHSESDFSVDKRWFGWTVEQRRSDRIETAISCVNVWHNLFRLYGD